MEPILRERFVIHGGSEDLSAIGQSCYTFDIRAGGMLYRGMCDCGSDIEAEIEIKIDAADIPENADFAKLGPDFSLLEDGKQIDFLIITHQHHDHIGFIARLRVFDQLRIAEGKQPLLAPHFKIWASPQAKEIISFTLHEGEKNEQHSLFDTAYILNRLHAFPKPGEYEVMPGLWVFVIEAGHIPGALSLAIRMENGEIIFISGDKCKHDQPVVKGAPSFMDWPMHWWPTQILGTDLTYGASRTTSFESEVERLIEKVALSHAEGKNIFIAALRIGRAQNVALWLSQALWIGRSGKDRIPLWLDGRIAQFYGILRNNRWSERDAALPRLGEESGLFPIDGREHREKLLKESGPHVILATGGMMDNGPIRQYMRRFLANKNSCFFATSWLSPLSDGYALSQLSKERRELPDKEYFLELDFEDGARECVPFLADFDQFNVGSHDSPKESLQYILDLAYLRISRGMSPLRRICLTHGTQRTMEAIKKQLAPIVDEVLSGERNTIIYLDE